MDVVRERLSLAKARARLPGPVGFVATMGALHAGHLALIERCRAECRSVVTSIFVNPTQFGPGEDYLRYPRNDEADLETCRNAGVDVVFVPGVEEIYPRGAATVVDVGPIGEVLEGARRPGHFRGVATVVTILFDLVQPDRTYFGQKDGQQVAVVARLVRDLGLPVELEVVPTVREPDGLALSSRNAYLTAPEREVAPVVARALRSAAGLYGEGERDAERLRGRMREMIAGAPLAELDYASVADRASMAELERVEGAALLSLAVRFPSARLIDCEPIG